MFVKRHIVFILLVVLAMNPSALAQVSHPSSEITPGNLTGDFRVTGVLTVGDLSGGLISNSDRTGIAGPSGSLKLSVYNDKVYIADKLGIGVTNPAAKLEVAGTGSAANPLLGLSSSQAGFFVPSPNVLAIETGTAERMRIGASGNVGIGTTNPNHRLDIEADDDVVSILSGRTAPGGNILAAENTLSRGLVVDSGGNVIITDGDDIPLLGGTVHQPATLYVRNGATDDVIRAEANSNSLHAWIRSQNRDGSSVGWFGANRVGGDCSNGACPSNAVMFGATGSNNPPIIFSTGNGGSFRERMRIADSGNIGIGTTNPLDILHVGNGADALVNGVAGQRMYLTFNGQTDFFIRDSTNDVLGRVTAYNGGVQVGSITDHEVEFLQNNNIEMIIDTDGEVGIGTTSPSKKLDVNGGVKGTELCIGNDCKTSWGQVGGERKFEKLASIASQVGDTFTVFNVPSYCKSADDGKSCTLYLVWKDDVNQQTTGGYNGVADVIQFSGSSVVNDGRGFSQLTYNTGGGGYVSAVLFINGDAEATVIVTTGEGNRNNCVVFDDHSVNGGETSQSQWVLRHTGDNVVNYGCAVYARAD